MKFRSILSLLLTALVFFSGVSSGYDHELAQGYAKLFQPVVGAAAGKELHLMTPEQMIKDLQENKQIVAIDVRTPNEAGVVGLTLPGSMQIPVNELFTQENLDKIPLDKKVVIICKSGTRATAVGTALRHIGFENVYILKGGIMGLTQFVDPKSMNPPPPKTALR